MTNAELAKALDATESEIENWKAEGWDPEDPQQLIDAHAVGLPVRLGEDLPEGESAWEWCDGADGGSYRIPSTVAERLSELRKEVNEVRRKMAAKEREHRAELKEALDVEDPDLKGTEPGNAGVIRHRRLDDQNRHIL